MSSKISAGRLSYSHPLTKLLFSQGFQTPEKQFSPSSPVSSLDTESGLPDDIAQSLKWIYNRHPPAIHSFDEDTVLNWANDDSSWDAARESIGDIISLLENESPETGVVLLNMGGPSNLTEIEVFLKNMFNDGDCIRFTKFPLGIRSWIADKVAINRAHRVSKDYNTIGGGSPIRYWTTRQAYLLEKELDILQPEFGPHRVYTAFRYTQPFTSQTLEHIALDETSRLVLFSQYPQWSCTTAGSSVNEFWNQVKAHPSHILQNAKYSLIDRWFDYPGFHKFNAKQILDSLNKFDSDTPPLILFSAHSLPSSVLSEAGDTYQNEVAVSAGSIMALVNSQLQSQNKSPLPWQVSYQSGLGKNWLGPFTADVCSSGQYPNILLVPIAFTSDHIETLFELDIELKEAAVDSYIERTPSYNGNPDFVSMVTAPLVREHMKRKENASSQFFTKCVKCPHPPGHCRNFFNPIDPLDKNLGLPGIDLRSQRMNDPLPNP